MPFRTAGVFHRGIAQLVEQRSPKPRAEGSNPSTPAKDRQCKTDGLFVFIYRKISGKQVGRTANAVLPVLYMCCVLLMGLSAGIGLISHQNTPTDAVAVLRYAVSGDNCRGEHCSPASLTKSPFFGIVIHAKSEDSHHAPPACRKTSICETDSSDAREVALAPERAKRGKHTFFDMQRAITVLPLYIALMRFLIKVKQHDLPDVIQCLQSCCKALFSVHKHKKTVSLTLTVFWQG